MSSQMQCKIAMTLSRGAAFGPARCLVLVVRLLLRGDDDVPLVPFFLGEGVFSSSKTANILTSVLAGLCDARYVAMRR